MVQIESLRDYLQEHGITCSRIFNEEDDRYEVKVDGYEIFYIYVENFHFHIVNEDDQVLRGFGSVESVYDWLVEHR